MIMGRVKMILLAVAVAAFMGLGGLAYWLYQDNQELAGEAQRLQQTNNALADSVQNQKAVADDLADDIKMLDDLALQAMQAREIADQKLQTARQALYESLEDNQCANEPHPSAIGDWLRKNSGGL